jgi:hypothetical protein
LLIFFDDTDQSITQPTTLKDPSKVSIGTTLHQVTEYHLCARGA